LPQRIKDLLPKELVEVDNKQILDNTLYSWYNTPLWLTYSIFIIYPLD
jgi:hypothetical protein